MTVVTIDDLARARFRGVMEQVAVAVRGQLDHLNPRAEPMRVARLEGLLLWTRQKHPIEIARRLAVSATLHEFRAWEQGRIGPTG